MSADKLASLKKQLFLISERESTDTPVVIGKDTLELLSISMYVDPMSIFREYIQNATDSIDEARRTGLFKPNDPGCISIDTNANDRTVKIRDNGFGLSHDYFENRLTSVGASKKKGTNARGFRGVGRLAGLGYCQELIFRSRVAGSPNVSELRWDCRKLRSLLRDDSFEGDLANVIRQTATVRRLKDGDLPDRFFEVELVGIVRHRNDQLLNPIAIQEYLTEIAPIPFAPGFRYAAEITDALSPHVKLGNIHIQLNGGSDPLYRPHRDAVELGGGAIEQFSELELLKVPAVDGEVAAVGWILHHGYSGALPAAAGVKGLRVRSGNIQIGNGDLLQELFPEPRFNSWTVGEIHVLDPRIVPNGRRDHFEQNVHLFNLLNHLSPVAREISRRCRANSLRRQWLRDFERHSALVSAKVSILRQRALGKIDRARVADEIQQLLLLMERIAGQDKLDITTKADLSTIIRGLRSSLTRSVQGTSRDSVLAHISPPKRRAYEQMIALIYECTPKQSDAKVLVDRIIAKLK